MTSPTQNPLGSSGGPTFTGPDGAEYAYSDPDASPDMSDVDSTTIEPPAEAPTEELVERPGESTPPVAPGASDPVQSF